MLVALGEVGEIDGNVIEVVDGNPRDVVDGSRKVDDDEKSNSVSVNGSSSSEVEEWVLKGDVVRVRDVVVEVSMMVEVSIPPGPTQV